MKRIAAILLAIATLTGTSLALGVAFGPLSTAAPASTCQLQVPPNPLTAQGLATPYQMSGCDETNPATSAFVQATIIDPSGHMSVYSPLVVNAGSPPTVPVLPTLVPGSTVGLFFGFDAIDLHLTGDPAARHCVNGLGGSDFGQFAYCNATPLFHAMDAAVAAGTLTVPPLGVSTLGDACPSVASFDIVDTDPSDNVQTSYLTGQGQVVQNTAANRALYPNATVLSNPSDNGLLTAVVDPAIGCTPWTAPDLADPGASVASMAMDEFQARHLQAAPFAAVPAMDEMTLTNNHKNDEKLALYRAGVDQTPTDFHSSQYYCTNLAKIFPPWFNLHAAELTATPSPAPGYSSLATFMAGRFVNTYEVVLPAPGVQPTCDQVTGIPDPVSLTTEVVGATATPVP